MRIGKFIPKAVEFYAFRYDGKGPAPKVGKETAKEGQMVIVEIVTIKGEYIAKDAVGNETVKPTKAEEYKPVAIVTEHQFKKLNEGADDCGRDIISQL